MLPRRIVVLPEKKINPYLPWGLKEHIHTYFFSSKSFILLYTFTFLIHLEFIIVNQNPYMWVSILFHWSSGPVSTIILVLKTSRTSLPTFLLFYRNVLTLPGPSRLVQLFKFQQKLFGDFVCNCTEFKDWFREICHIYNIEFPCMNMIYWPSFMPFEDVL